MPLGPSPYVCVCEESIVFILLEFVTTRDFSLPDTTEIFPSQKWDESTKVSQTYLPTTLPANDEKIG